MAQGVNGDRLEDQMKVDRPSDQLHPREVKILAISALKMKCTHTQHQHQHHLPAQSHALPPSRWIVAPCLISKSPQNPEPCNLLENKPRCDLGQGRLPGSGLIQATDAHAMVWLCICTS